MKYIYILSVLLLVNTVCCYSNSQETSKGKTVNNVSAPTKKTGDIRIMQYNIHYGVGSDEKYDVHRIIDVLVKSKADIIILNEVDKHYSNRSGFMYMAAYIAQQMGMNYVHASSIVLPPNKDSGGNMREVGNSFLTKFKLDSLDTHKFSKGDKYDRIITKVRIILDNGKVLYVAGTHFGLIQENRVIQAKETLNFLSDILDKPLIFAGDLNAEPNTEEINILKSKFKDAFEGKTLNTFSVDDPVKTIDYIFGTDKIKFRNNGTTLITDASDHYPIIVDIDLNN